jgi:prepilin peptidase CpaA
VSTSELVPPLLFTVLVLTGAVLDVRSRRLPNTLSLALAVSGLAAILFAAGLADAGSALAHLGISLVIGMGLYALGMWGGGDAKFYAGTAAWFTLSEALPLLLWVSMAGVALLIAWFVGRRLSGQPITRSRKGEVPYGVAIAAGGIVLMWSQAA